jgi:hypothetical protein
MSTTPTPVAKVTSPASLVSELQNPATYVTAALVVTSVIQAFNLPSHYGSIALAIVHIAAIVAGPLAAIAYAFAHAAKASAHEGRLAEVEAALVAAAKDAYSIAGGNPEAAMTYLKNVLALVRSDIVTVSGPAGKDGALGRPGPVGAPGPKGDKGEDGATLTDLVTTLQKELPQPTPNPVTPVPNPVVPQPTSITSQVVPDPSA